MHRGKFLQLLNEYQPTNRKEISFKQEMLEFVEQHENCFERSLSKGHITASAWLLNQSGTHALLLHHAKLDRWFQLGGHCDGDPDPLNVAIKEAKEESGLQDIQPISKAIFDIDIHLIPENPKEGAHFHYDVRFLLQSFNSDQIIPNRESKSLLWVDKNLENLPTNNPSVVRMFQKWINLMSYE